MTQLQQAYAQGLYDLAQEEGLTEQLLEQLEVLKKTLAQEPDYLRLLSTPAVPKQERCRLLDEAFRDRVHIYVLNFMKILTEKGHMSQFSGCCRAFRQQYNLDRGILPVRVISAVELTDLQQQRLREKLTGMTGKTICLECVLDAQVLGGVRLEYDGMQIDGTVRTRLDEVRKLLERTVV